MPFYGAPLGIRPRSAESVMIVEPTLGIDSSQPSVDAPLGSTPQSLNFVMRDGALEPRPMLTLSNTTPQPMGSVAITGAHELVSVGNTRYPLVSGTTRWAVYNQGGIAGWSVLSYVSAYGLNDPPAGGDTDYWDFTQTYFAERDETIAVGANASYQTLYCTQSNTTVFSSLTGAPRAKFVTAADNYLLAFNIREDTNEYVQRVQWNDRGSASSWTGGLSGFEDLLAMRGQGTRAVYADGRVVLFSDAEIWQGVQRDFPFVWSFGPLDSSVGCPYSWTVADTPLGLMFLSKDFQVYLLPKGGGSATPIGQRLHRSIRNSIDQPARAWAVYDHTLSQYQLFYPIRGGSGRPERAVYLDIGAGSWAPQSYRHSLTRGVEIGVSSSATSWGGLSAAAVRWADMAQTWSELAGASEERAVLAGSSNGTLFTFNSTATSDNGTAVQSTWQSTGLAGEDASHQKTVTEFRADYQADSASSLSVRYSTTLGASFGLERRLDMASASYLSQAIDYPYFSARYPVFEVASEAQRYRLFRFSLSYRRGGR